MSLNNDELRQIFCYEIELIEKCKGDKWFPNFEPERKESEIKCYRGKNGYVRELITVIMTQFSKIFPKKNWKDWKTNMTNMSWRFMKNLKMILFRKEN